MCVFLLVTCPTRRPRANLPRRSRCFIRLSTQRPAEPVEPSRCLTLGSQNMSTIARHVLRNPALLYLPGQRSDAAKNCLLRKTWQTIPRNSKLMFNKTNFHHPSACPSSKCNEAGVDLLVPLYQPPIQGIWLIEKVTFDSSRGRSQVPQLIS